MTLTRAECPQLGSGDAFSPGKGKWTRGVKLGRWQPGVPASTLPVLPEPIPLIRRAHGVLTPGAAACNAGLDLSSNGRKQPNGDGEDEADRESRD